MTGKSYFIFMFLSLTSIFYSVVAAQENPPIPVKVEVNRAQDLNFGAFTVDATGGELSIDHDGQITREINVFPLNFGESPTPAIFDVTAIPGTLIRIQTPYVMTLEGSNGGTIDLKIDSFSTGQVFITTKNPPMVNPVLVGGTLIIPANNIPGSYSGTFTLTFIHE